MLRVRKWVRLKRWTNRKWVHVALCTCGTIWHVQARIISLRLNRFFLNADFGEWVSVRKTPIRVEHGPLCRERISVDHLLDQWDQIGSFHHLPLRYFRFRDQSSAPLLVFRSFAYNCVSSGQLLAQGTGSSHEWTDGNVRSIINLDYSSSYFVVVVVVVRTSIWSMVNKVHAGLNLGSYVMRFSNSPEKV